MKNKKTFILFMMLLMAMSLLFVGCVKKKNNGKTSAGLNGNESESETTTDKEKRYSSEDLIIITSIDTDKSQIAVQSIKDGNKYILNYTSGTSIQNKYGSELLMSQMMIGEVADVYYVGGTQKLIAIKESDTAWENTTVTKWKVDYDNNKIEIGGVSYKYDEMLFVNSKGRNIDIREVSSVDKLIVKGIDKQIYSVIVDVGHGYIKLTDTVNMVGGIVEVGTSIMTLITEDMIIVAPEGEYTLTASKSGVGGSTSVTVLRDDEVTVSLSSFQGEVIRNGSVNFTVKPDGIEASMYIDGTKVDYTELVDLSYGKHKVVIRSNLYDDYTAYLTVDSIYINKTFDVSGSTSDETTAAETTTTVANTTYNNKVTISTPEGASLYLDGVFVGTIPVSFTKASGSHVMILRQTGYDTVVYNTEFSDDTKDVTLTLPAMELSE